MADETPRFRHRRIELGKAVVKSLAWRGDTLVDWVNGSQEWTADGKFEQGYYGIGYDRFNAVVTDQTGRWAVVHERTGTAAYVMRDGRGVRELHRSYYRAHAYEYPVCLFERDGRMLLVHCPERYNKLEIDDALTGERLTQGGDRKPTDLFHSRLSVSPGRKRLMSAGWCWQPTDLVGFFDLQKAIASSDELDAPNQPPFTGTGESSAVWLDDDRVIIGGDDYEEEPDEEAESGPRLKPNSLAVYDLVGEKYVRRVELGYTPGAMMRVGPRHVLTLFKHPRLVSLQDEKVVQEWPEIDSGSVTSSIVWDRPYPNFAIDQARARVAIAGTTHIDVIEFDVA